MQGVSRLLKITLIHCYENTKSIDNSLKNFNPSLWKREEYWHLFKITLIRRYENAGNAVSIDKSFKNIKPLLWQCREYQQLHK